MRAEKLNFAKLVIITRYFRKHYLPWMGVVVLFLLFVTGLTLWQFAFVKKELRKNLINKIEILGDAISTNSLRRISESQKLSDNLVEQLNIYQNYLGGGKIFFIRAETDGGRIVLADDSENSNYKFGEIYSDPAKLYQKVISHKQTQISDIYSVNNQKRITVLHPFLVGKDSETELLGGIDYPAEEYISRLKKVRRNNVVVILSLSLLYLFIITSIIWRDKQSIAIRQKFRHIETVAVLLTGLFLTGAALHVNEGISRKERDLSFKYIAGTQQMNLQQTFLNIEKNLSLLASFIRNQDSVEYEKFVDFIVSLVDLNFTDAVLMFEPQDNSGEISDGFIEKLMMPDNKFLNLKYVFSPEDEEFEKRISSENSIAIKQVITNAIVKKGVATSGITMNGISQADENFIAVAYPFSKNNTNDNYVGNNQFGGVILAILEPQKVINKLLSKSNNFGELVKLSFWEINDSNSYKCLAAYPFDHLEMHQQESLSSHLKDYVHEQNIPLFMFNNIYIIEAHSTKKFESQYTIFRKYTIIFVGLIFTLVVVVLVAITRNRWILMEKSIYYGTKNLNRKVKDLVCLREINEERHKKHSPDTFLPAVVNIIKRNYPDEIKAVSLKYNNQEYGDTLKRTENLKTLDLKFKVSANNRGVIRIAVSPEYTFSKSDEKQLRQIADKIGICLAHYTASLNFKVSENRFQTFIDNATDGIYLLRGKQFIYVNKSYQEMLGYTKKELLSKSFDINVLLTEKSREIFNNRYKARVQGKELPPTYEFQYKTKSGQVRDAEVNIVSLPDYDKLTVMGISKDITEKKEAKKALIESQRKMQEQNTELLRLNEELLKINKRTWKLNQELTFARLKAEAGSRIKSAFLNNISHEVRTPLNGIVGASALIGEADISDSERQELIEIIHKSSSRLLSTITHYMDISLLQSGEMPLRLKSFNLSELILSLEERYKHEARVRKLQFNIVSEINPELKYIYSDKELIYKMLSLILDNAFKFTQRGSIDFIIRSDYPYISFEIRDTGIGIEPEFYNQVFNYFMQEDVGNTRKYEGSGLGLAICKGLVNLLGGKISFSSQKNIGTNFCIQIPVQKKKAPDLSPEIADSSYEIREDSGPVILIAEDEELSFSIISKFLQKKMNTVIIRASNGREAVDHVKQNNDISLVLMDLKMPVMDGYEATRIIKAFRPTLPVIAITTYGLTGDETKAIDAGCDDYLAKPVDTVDLLEKIEKHLSKEYLKKARNIQNKYRE